MAKYSYINGIARISLHGGSSRVRVPAEVAKEWGAPEQFDSFRCEGYFRGLGEFLCVPEWACEPNEPHPLSTLVGYDLPEPEEGFNFRAARQVPSAQALFARFRFSQFEAKWASTSRQQLDLHVGVRICERLLHSANEEVIRAVTWGKVLVLVSEAVFNDLQKDPLPNRSDFDA